MRVIRPRALSATARRRPMLLAISMVVAGVLAMELTLVASTTTTGAAIGAAPRPSRWALERRARPDLSAEPVAAGHRRVERPPR